MVPSHISVQIGCLVSVLLESAGDESWGTIKRSKRAPMMLKSANHRDSSQKHRLRISTRKMTIVTHHATTSSTAAKGRTTELVSSQ